MGHSIAVMNTKGGVGKSTIVMALAETLAVFHGKNILVIDSDSQTSMSTMLMSTSRWEQLERQHLTLVDYLMQVVLQGATIDWRPFVVGGVSDVDDAKSIYLVPSHMELSLFERVVSAERREDGLRSAVRNFIGEAKRVFDIVLVDCPPGLSVLTECWLRECDYFLPPTKPDYLSFRGLTVLKRFRETHSEQGFADLLGVLVNLKDARIGADEEWHRRLASDASNRCFEAAVPRRAYIQRAADFDTDKRTYIAKYPGDAGQSVRRVTQEVLARLAGEPLPAIVPPAASGASTRQPAAAAPAGADGAATKASQQPAGRSDDAPIALREPVQTPAPRPGQPPPMAASRPAAAPIVRAVARPVAAPPDRGLAAPRRGLPPPRDGQPARRGELDATGTGHDDAVVSLTALNAPLVK